MYDNRNERNYISISIDKKTGKIKSTLHNFNSTDKYGISEEGKSHGDLGLDDVNKAIKEFIELRSSTFDDLVAVRKIRISKPVFEKYIINYDKTFIEKGIRRDGHLEGITNREAIINEIIRLNPTVRFAVGKDADGNIDSLYSSEPGESLVLPEGFEYNDENGITNEHHTSSDMLISIPVKPLPLVREEDHDDRSIGGTAGGGEPHRDGSPSGTAGGGEAHDDGRPSGAAGGGEAHDDGSPSGAAGGGEAHDDGSPSGARESEESDEPEKRPTVWRRIKNLVIVNSGLLAKILAYGLSITALVYLLSEASKKKETSVDSKRDPYSTEDNVGEAEEIFDYDENNGVIYVDPALEEIVYNEPTGDKYVSEYSNPVDYSYDYILSKDMEGQLDEIAGTCYQNIGDVYNFLNGNSGLCESMEPIHLENIVQSGDKDAISTIMAARNSVIESAYTSRDRTSTSTGVHTFLLDYVNYAYEGGTVFNGQAIKAYDYLDSYSQYIVTVVGESMLQLYPDFNYSTPYANYNYYDLIEKITNTHGEICDSLINGRRY